MHRRATTKVVIVVAIVACWYGVFAAAGNTVYLPNVERFPPPTPTETTTSTPTETPQPTATQTPTATREPAGWHALLFDSFEGAFPPGQWAYVGDDNGAAAGEYYWGKSSCQKVDGGYSAWAVGAGADGRHLKCNAVYPGYVDTWMVNGRYDLRNATGATLSAKLWVRTQGSGDQVCLLAAHGESDYWGWCYFGDFGGWTDGLVDLQNVPTLGNLTGQDDIRIALWFGSDGTNQFSQGAFADQVLFQKYVPAGLGGQGVAPAKDPVVPTGAHRVVAHMRFAGKVEFSER